ncbi:hypothetical protein OROMI_018733 [Orobanche minor]
MVAGGGGQCHLCRYGVEDLGFAEELGNYAEYSGTPNKEEVLHIPVIVSSGP